MSFRQQLQPLYGKRLKAKEAPSKFFHHAFPKSFPVIFQRISSISEDSLGIPSPFFVLIRTSYIVSSWGRRFFSSGVRSTFWLMRLRCSRALSKSFLAAGMLY